MQGLRSVVFRGREDKLSEVGRLFSNYLRGNVLDIGCDAKYLAKWVGGRYVGVDNAGWPDVRVNAEEGLPFHDRSFDCVVAFDILEHCDRIHFAFDEFCRVSRCYVIVGLPNMCEWHFRLKFLLGMRMNGKYGLPHEPPTDRHRWLFGLNDARDFVTIRGAALGFAISAESLGYYGYRLFLPRQITKLAMCLAPWGASLFAYHYWVVLERASRAGGSSQHSRAFELRAAGSTD